MIAAPGGHASGRQRTVGDSIRHMRELTGDEAMQRLRSVQVGRTLFTMHALPAVRPVNHRVIDGQVIIRTREGSAIVTAASVGRGVVVAYEADELDTAARTGWSVVVTGIARIVTDRQEADSYREAVRPWVEGQMDYVVRVSPEIVTGFELVAGRRDRVG